MAMNQRLLDQYKPAVAAPAANYTGAAMTAFWVNTKYFNHWTVLLQTGAWAGGSSTFSLNQGTSIAGAGSKALNFLWSWTITSTADTPTVTNALPASPTTSITVNAANTLYAIEFDTAVMDINNSFTFFTAAVTSPGVNADFYSVTYLGLWGRYQQQSMPTILA